MHVYNLIASITCRSVELYYYQLESWVGFWNIVPPTHRPCTNTFEIFRSSPQKRNLSKYSSKLPLFSVPVLEKESFVLHTAGFVVCGLTDTTNASKLFPGSMVPIRWERLQSSAPPTVARYNNVAIGSCLLENLAIGTGIVSVAVGGACIARIFEQMLACWMTVRMDGENPPDTSVPRPTWRQHKYNVRLP